MTEEDSCLDVVLGLYGYENMMQQGHAELLELAGIKIPEEYTYCPCQEGATHNAHKWLIQATQEKFRPKSTKKRWEEPAFEWISENSIQVLDIGEKLGLFGRTSSKGKDFDCVAVFGATVPTMESRIHDLVTRIETKELTTKQVFLLTGERYADINGDGESAIQRVAEKLNTAPSQVTEATLMSSIYEDMVLNTQKLKNIPVTTINAPAKKEGAKTFRPNTVDTIVAFLDTLQPGECQTTLFISQAPYIKAQAESVRAVMYMRRHKMNFEVVGERVVTTTNTLMAYHLLIALAGEFYGGFDRVSRKIDSLTPCCFRYRKNPL